MGEIQIEATNLRPQAERKIDAPLVTIDIPYFIKQLLSEKTWKKKDRNSITVFKTTEMRIVLIALHKGAEMVRHTTKGLISVQILKGELEFKTDEQLVKLKKEDMLTLQHNIPHYIRAKKKTFFLLTLIMQAGDQDTNHLEKMKENKVNGKLISKEIV